MQFHVSCVLLGFDFCHSYWSLAIQTQTFSFLEDVKKLVTTVPPNSIGPSSPMFIRSLS